LKLGDFKVAGCDLAPQLLLTDLGLIKLLTGSQCAMVYGGDESKGDCMDGVVDVGVHAEEYFGSVGGDRWELLFGFLVGDGQVEGWGFVFGGDDCVGKVGGGSLSKGG